MPQTILLQCGRVGNGFTVTKEFKINKIIKAGALIDYGMYPQHITPIEVTVKEYKKCGFKKWLRDNQQLLAVAIKSTYLFTFEAPGSWCQVFWIFDELKYDQKRLLMDMSGEHIFDTLLSDFTTEQKNRHWEVYLRA